MLVNDDRRGVLLDFSAINQAQQGLQKKDEARHQKSKQLYEQGRQWVREALLQPINKTKFKQAVDCFSNGIQSNYKNPDNYWGLGFLFLALNQPLKSLPYLKSGLELAPQSRLGKALLQQAQTGLVSVGPKKHLEMKPAESEPYFIDFDQLHDETANSILALLKKLLSTPQAVFSLEHHFFAVLKTQYEADLIQQQALAHDVEILDAEIDVSNLQIHIATIQRKLKHMHYFIACQSDFLDLHAQIQTALSLVEQQIELISGIYTPTAIASWDNSLHQMLDECDRIADRLDDLSEKKVDISLLEQSYTHYVARLATLQDLFEEH